MWPGGATGVSSVLWTHLLNEKIFGENTNNGRNGNHSSQKISLITVQDNLGAKWGILGNYKNTHVINNQQHTTPPLPQIAK